MRTPNCKCVICGKSLYRRPGHLARIRYVACMADRGEAQRREGLTEKQRASLALGRQKGTNHLNGIPKSEGSKQKRSRAMKIWCTENPDALMARSKNIRGSNHYLWNGGSSSLNISIRQMTENRKWINAVKARDEKCLRCGSTYELEAHHKTPLAELIERLGIKDRADARRRAAILWDMDNGETICQRCHYDEHGRKHYEDRRSNIQATT